MGKRMLIVSLYIVASWTVLHAQGYRIESDRIVVEGENWEAWDHPKGVLEFDEEGELHPRFVHKNINACLDAHRFSLPKTRYSSERVPGGSRFAGSNPEDVVNVMDGDPSTFWEPSAEDSLEDWWFEIDLGRLVSATRIVLRFVEEGLGDPFLQFSVEVSDGWSPSRTATDWFSYRTVGRIEEGNEERRLFQFELSLPVQSYADQFPGDVVRFVRVKVRDTKGDRREEVSKETYEQLPPDWRGRIEYYRITAAGEEELISEEGYEKLSSVQKGPIRYYRREKPRLAEVEVWSVGENLSLGILDREGSVETPLTGSTEPIDGFDGDLRTRQILADYSKARWIMADLGGWFWVDTVRLLVTRQRQGITFRTSGYRIDVSDGTKASGGDLSWTPASESRWDDGIEGPSRTLPVSRASEIGPTIFYLEDVFGPFKVRFLRFQARPSPPYAMSLYEAQIFGEGYVAEIPLTSKIIEVGTVRNLSSVRWVADTPPGTSVEIQTRTGDRMDEEKLYYNKSGVEITAYQWHKLPGFFKGPIKSRPIPGSDWSPWSRAYEHSGDRFQSPSPKKYLQIRVKLLSDDPYRAASLKSLSIPFTVPLTERITGTRSPEEVQRLGAPEVFTIKIHPVLQEEHPGFNQLFVQTLDMMEMELVELEVRKDGGGVIESRPSTDWTDQVEILPTQPDTLWMVLPDTIQAGDTDEITLQFLSALYRDGTVFNLFVGNTALPGVWQQVESEDFHAYSKTFMVFAPEKNRNMIDNVRLEPSVITPNGDGINDVLTVHFTVGRIQAERPVRLTIYDLSGKKVRHMVEQRPKYPLGKYAMEWDGRDEEGRLVPPGLYLVAIRVKSNWHLAENTEIWRRGYVVY